MDSNGVNDEVSSVLENALDLALLNAARADDDYLPWEQAKQELGLA